MPPRGYKKPVALTAEDYGNSAELVNAAAITLSVVAKKHPEMPMLLAAITFAQQASEQLHAQRGQAEQVHRLQDAGRPAEEGQ